MLAGFLNTIILLGSLQGVIISGLLFFGKKNQPANRLLALLILLIATASFNLYGAYKNWFDLPLLRLIFDFIPLVLVMPVGPLLYFYIRSSLEPGYTITKKQRRHFYLVIVDLVPSATAFIYLGGLVAKIFKNNPAPWGNFIDDYNVYADIPRWLSLSFYTWRSFKYLRQYRLNSAPATQQLAATVWLQQMVTAFIIFQSIWLIYLVPYVIPKYTNWMLDNFEWYPIYIPMAILIYWLGIKGWLASQHIAAAEKKQVAGNNPLSPGLVQQVMASLTKLMDNDRAFLNPDLNLSSVANSTGFQAKIVSAVINQHLQKSFNEWVNGYRVQAFKDKILDPAMSHLTIAGIAMECGFNSQATFQRSFKEITGQSPSAYRKTAIAC